MAVSLGMSIGESFAEFYASPELKIAPQRLFLAKKNLSEGLKDFLGARLAEGGAISITTSLPAYAIQKRLGSTPVFLVTTGFENWLKLQQPLADDHPQLFPERAPTGVSDDHTFGIAERIRADGSVETAINDEDLQFLAAKLELLKTRTIAVGLLHSDKNPAHEQNIRTFFEGKGFRVFCSHEYFSEGAHETERWRKVLKAASVWTAVCEQRDQIEAALGEHKDKWTIRYVSQKSGTTRLLETPGIEAEFGAAVALQAAFPAASILHLDVEQFLFLQKGRTRVLKVQPTTPLQRTSWPFAVYADVPIGYEPGPMAFGKSLQPTAFDIFYLRERLEPIEAVTPLLNEKSKPRILETLFTLSKEIPSKSRIDAQMVAADLETALLDRLNEEILLAGPNVKEILLTGALARSLHPRLEVRRPDLKFKLAEDTEFATASATLRMGAST